VVVGFAAARQQASLPAQPLIGKDADRLLQADRSRESHFGACHPPHDVGLGRLDCVRSEGPREPLRVDV
jgi:hypothetical protein